MYAARVDDAEFSEGIEFGAYVMSRTADCWLKTAEFASPGVKFTVSAESTCCDCL